MLLGLLLPAQQILTERFNFIAIADHAGGHDEHLILMMEKQQCVFERNDRLKIGGGQR